MPAIAWTTIRNAIATWIESTTSLPTHWEGQNAPRPSGSYISLQFISQGSVGRDWIDREVDLGGDPGEEIINTVRGPRRLLLSVQAFTAGDALGNTSAEAYLEDVKAALRFDSVLAALNAAKISVQAGDIRNVGATLNTSVFEPRAVMDCVCYTVSELTETGTYIETVEVTDLETGVTTTVTTS